MRGVHLGSCRLLLLLLLSPPQLQCLLHSFAITLHTTNVITLQNRLVSNTCSTSNLSNCLKIIHEDSNLLMLLFGVILALAVQVTVPGCMFAFFLRAMLSVAYIFVHLLIFRHILLRNVSTEIVESEQSLRKKSYIVDAKNALTTFSNVSRFLVICRQQGTERVSLLFEEL